MVKTGRFLDDHKDSLWMGYHDNGKIKYMVWYKNDEVTDTARYFDSSGEFMYSLVYDEFGLVSYQYQGTEGMVSKNINPSDSGIITTYYKNGKNSSKLAYKYGKLRGKQMQYFSNGNLAMESFLAENNLLDGKYTEYFENGKVRCIENYLLGQNHGIQQYFRADGTPDYVEEYRCDNRHGTFTRYDSKGKQIKQDKYWGNVLLN
jgi:antitoxin component YwqK of YwqJK toxin-antitoxin module